MKATALGLTYVVLTTILTNAAVANTASDEQAVRKVLASFDEAFNRHDADAVSALFTDDAEFVNSWNVVAETGGDQTRECFRAREHFSEHPLADRFGFSAISNP